MGIHMSKLIKLYALNMCVILYANYASLKLKNGIENFETKISLCIKQES